MARLRNAIRALSRVPSAAASRPRLLLMLWGSVLAILLAAVAFLGVHVRHNDEVDASRQAAIDAGKEQLVEVLSYNFKTIDEDIAQAKGQLTGKFAEDFGRLADKLIVPTAKKDDIRTDAEVVGASSVSAEPDRVVLLMFVNQTTNSKRSSEPRIDGSRIRLTMARVDDRWLISELTPL